MPYRPIALTSLLALLAACGPSVAADKPSEAQIKQVVMSRDGNAPQNFTWRSVQTAAPRRASNGEIGALGLPPNATVVPVIVDYTEDTGGGWVRDHVQHYMFYQDDFKKWTAQPDSVPGNMTSEPHRK